MNLFKINKDQVGATLIEVLVAIGLLGIMLPALTEAILTSNTAQPTTTQRLYATYLLQEITQATRNIRETNWNSFATDGTYHPVISGSKWALSSGSGISGGFNNQIVISDVERDSSGNIVSSGGTVDPSIKKSCRYRILDRANKFVNYYRHVS
jgi:type II secretory pathway pseudopilin PulG